MRANVAGPPAWPASVARRLRTADHLALALLRLGVVGGGSLALCIAAWHGALALLGLG